MALCWLARDQRTTTITSFEGFVNNLPLRFYLWACEESMASVLSGIIWLFLLQPTTLHFCSVRCQQTTCTYTHSNRALSWQSILTCSKSSVIDFGSSWRWNHIMYLVWNLQDCFFKAFAAKYWALVPCKTTTNKHTLQWQHGHRAIIYLSLCFDTLELNLHNRDFKRECFSKEITFLLQTCTAFLL